MSTFITLNSRLDRKNKKVTTFEKVLDSDLKAMKTSSKPKMYDYVLHIGNDKAYGDVFKAWDEGREGNFVIFFGTKGDEFND